MKGYVLGYDLRRRAPDRNRGTRDARARGRRRRPRASCCCTAGATRPTRWRPLLAQLGRAAAGARSRSTCPASARRPACTTARCCPSWTRSRSTSSRAGRTRSRWSSRARSLGGCVALRLAEHPGNVRLAGVVPVAPGRAGAAVLVRPDRGGPDRPPAALDPGPGAGRSSCAAARSSAYRQLRLPAPERHAARRRRRLQPRRRDARGPRRAARLRPRARPGALARARST